MFGNDIMDMVFAPWRANAFFAANRLNIFTLLAEKDKTVEELAGETGAVPYRLKPLLDACAAMGLLIRENDGYRNSHMSHVSLVEGRPRYAGDIIEVVGVENRVGEKLYNVIMGEEEKKRDTEYMISTHVFTMAMNNIAMQGEAEALAKGVNLSGCRRIADVGCGSGIYSITLCRHRPDLRATLLDRKEVLETTKRIIKQYELEDRVETQAADIEKDDYGQNLDVVLLSDVLYQEKKTCLGILQSAQKALVPGGRLIIRGYYPDPEGTNPVFGALFTLARLSDNPNRAIITVSLLIEWLKETGFINIESFPISGRSTCLTVKK